MKRALSLLLVCLSLSSCSKFMNGLRRDLDDSDPYVSSGPTTGGTWSERGLLGDEDRYAAVGHSERGPASLGRRSPGDSGSWVTPEHEDANRRDQFRGRVEEGDAEPTLPSYGTNPNLPPQTRRMYKNGSRATRDDFVDGSSNEGSLWGSDGQTNYYFTKNKVRGIGDIVTVNIEADLLKDTVTEVGRTLTPREREMELAYAQERLRMKALGIEDPSAKKDAVATSAAAPTRAPAAAQPGSKKNEDEIDVPRASLSDIDVSKSLELKAGDTIMAEVVDRFPNGNYKIRGTKRVRYRNGFRLMSLMAVVKGSDIGEDDTVNSGKLYEYRLEALR